MVRQRIFAGFCATALFLQVQTGYAQVDWAVRESNTEADSARGYWRLKTLATTRSTMIQFFGPGDQLLYEEIMPEKWVKLTRKNQQQFDQLLAQLLNNQLLTSRIKTESLPPTPDEPAANRVAVRAAGSSSTSGAYNVHMYVNQAGKLYVIVDNPDRLRYKISLVDQHNRLLYEEFTNHDQYRRRLDVSALPLTAYQAVVLIDGKPFTYRVKSQRNRIVFGSQPLLVDPQTTTPEGNQDENKPLFRSIPINL
jgi:hypothetical protein